MPENCRFCTVPDPGRVLLSTDNLFVMLSLGPITPGYCLVLSREHHSCMADALGTGLTDEFRYLLDLTRAIQEQTYGHTQVMEHGRTGSCVPGGVGEDHCYHAHVHSACTSVALVDTVATELECVRFASWPELAAWYEVEQLPYVLVEDADGSLLVSTPEELPRQYLRTRLAELEGDPELADYVAVQGWDVIRRSYETLLPIAAEVLDRDPPRFGVRTGWHR